MLNVGIITVARNTYMSSAIESIAYTLSPRIRRHDFCAIDSYRVAALEIASGTLILTRA